MKLNNQLLGVLVSNLPDLIFYKFYTNQHIKFQVVLQTIFFVQLGNPQVQKNALSHCLVKNTAIVWKNNSKKYSV